jgi:hypothetical protein
MELVCMVDKQRREREILKTSKQIERERRRLRYRQMGVDRQVGRKRM